MVNKKEPEFDNLKNFQPLYIAKDAKMCSRERAKGEAGQTWLKILGIFFY